MPSRTPFGPRAPARRGETAGVPPGFAARTVLRPYDTQDAHAAAGLLWGGLKRVPTDDNGCGCDCVLLGARHAVPLRIPICAVREERSVGGPGRGEACPMRHRNSRPCPACFAPTPSYEGAGLRDGIVAGLTTAPAVSAECAADRWHAGGLSAQCSVRRGRFIPLATRYRGASRPMDSCDR